MAGRVIAAQTAEDELVAGLTTILRATPPLMQMMRAGRSLDPPDWLEFSGAVYQPVLTHLTGRACDCGIKDYDLAYFDGSDLSYEAEDAVIRRVKAAFDEALRSMVEVRNQARVHPWFEAKFGEPYTPLLHRRGSGALHLGDVRGWCASRTRRPLAHRRSLRSRRSVRDAPASQPLTKDTRFHSSL